MVCEIGVGSVGLLVAGVAYIECATAMLAEEEDQLFMTAREFPVVQNPTPQYPTPQYPLPLYPITPDASVEMGITTLSVWMASGNLQHSLEDSVSSVTSSSVLERAGFLNEVCSIYGQGLYYYIIRNI